MKARLRLLPFDKPLAVHQIEEICTITELLQKLDAPEEFYTDGKVLIDNHEIYKDSWGKIKVKPKARGFIDLCLIPGNKSTAMLLASVALAVAVTAISAGALGPAGLGILGASFGAGGLGASLAAAGVGLAGAYALGQLTALPQSAQAEAATEALSQAGISANALRPDELLPIIIGEIGYSPPQISRAYETFTNGDITIHGIFGVEGRCSVNGLKVNETDINLIEGLDYEHREGNPGDAPLTLSQLICIQNKSNEKLGTHDTEYLTNKVDQLKDQVTPANSLPPYHYFTTKGISNEIWIRLLFPGGMVNVLDADYTVGILFRVELREKGTSTWRNCPTLHLWDENKGIGQIRLEIKLKFSRMGDGPRWGRAAGEYVIVGARDKQADTKTWEYVADPYFNKGANPADNLPVFTAATTSGVTITTSSVSGANVGWNACDGNLTTSLWEVLLVNLPAWIKWDFGVGNSRTYKSFMMGGASAGDNWAAAEGYLEGSNDDTNWTLLSTFSSDVVAQHRYGFIKDYAAYRYYRFTVTNNLGAVTYFRMYNWEFYTDDVYSGDYAGGPSLAHYVSLNEDGVEIYLDPAQGWNIAEYEVRIKRSLAFAANHYFFDSVPDNYGGGGTGVNVTNFFGYKLSGAVAVAEVAPRHYKSDLHLEVFSTVNYDPPVDTSGICCIAVEAKNISIQSVYAIFKSYASLYDGAVWSEIQVPTSNPAALYRAILLGYGNVDPAPGEVIQQDVFEDWFANCVTGGHECNMVVSGQVIRDVKQIVATCGMASPRDSNELGIIEDLDTSAQPPRNPLTPANSKNLGSQLILPVLPHGVRVEFFDKTDDYKINSVTIYRAGFDAMNSSLFETRRYPGFTDVAKVTARAIFDLEQIQFRARRYIREVGIEGLNFERGQLSSINDDVLEATQAAGWIKSVQTSGANVVSVTLTNVMPWGRAQGDFAQVDDVTTLTDVLDVDVPMGIFIRDNNGDEIYKQVSNITDSNVCTFTTPFLLAGSGVEAGLMVGAGKWGNLERRVKLIAKKPKSMDKWVLELADEAPQLFLP